MAVVARFDAAGRRFPAAVAMVLGLAGCGEVGTIAVAVGRDPGVPGYGVVTVTGLPATARRALTRGGGAARAYAVAPGDTLDPSAPMAGTWRAEGRAVRFQPAFPPRGGLVLWVTIDTAGLAGRHAPPLRRTFELSSDRTPGPAPRLVAIHPAADTVPENLLRFYLEFATPMEPGQALQRVRLVDDAGREVARAFLDVSQELWDPSGTRLTLLFDPGRVKRGIRTNLEEGRPLRVGKHYRLEVAAGWRDRRGQRLEEPVEKSFVSGPDDDRGPDPAAWSVSPPAIGSRDPLIVSFGEPLDHALAARLIAVQTEPGETVAGRVEVEAGDRVWRFIPDARWLAGKHRLVVSPELEDLAGNRPGRAFDVDLTRAPPAESVSRAPIVRWFEPRAREIARR